MRGPQPLMPHPLVRRDQRPLFWFFGRPSPPRQLATPGIPSRQRHRSRARPRPARRPTTPGASTAMTAPTPPVPHGGDATATAAAAPPTTWGTSPQPPNPLSSQRNQPGLRSYRSGASVFKDSRTQRTPRRRVLAVTSAVNGVEKPASRDSPDSLESPHRAAPVVTVVVTA